MLVDLPDGWWGYRNPVTEILAGPDYSPGHVATGVYLTHFNFTHDIRSLIVSEYPFDFSHRYTHEERREMGEEAWLKLLSEHDWVNTPHDYGVCDDWTQIIQRWPEIATSDRRLVVSLTEVRREDQPESGGWRWHKWGEYIGDHDPQYEYLYDEDPSIESVFCFHIFEVK